MDDDEQAVWSLLLASGYVKVKRFEAYMSDFGEWKQEYELELTNFEVKAMFRNMVRKWFAGASSGYNDFIKALLLGDVKAMNTYMNRVALSTFSYFDTRWPGSMETITMSSYAAMARQRCTLRERTKAMPESKIRLWRLLAES